MKNWLFLFLLFITTCFAKTDQLLDGENPNPLSNYEGLPNSIVGGCVNVITGDYFEHSVDLTLPLPDPLVISRSYTSSDTFGPSFEKGSLMHGWSLNHGGELLTYHFDDEFSFHNYCQVRAAGMSLRFDRKAKPKKHHYLLAKDLFKYGLTNTGRGMISGQTNLKNIYAVHDKKENQYLVKEGSGAEKNFDRIKKHQYRLISEKRPNGTTIQYDYDKNDITKISVLNLQNEEIAWVKINKPDSIKENPQIVVESCDNRHAYYNFIDRGSKKYILTEAHRTEGPAELYSYEPLTKRVGHFSRVCERKYANNFTRRVEYYTSSSKTTTTAPHSYIDCKVKALFESPSHVPLYTFEYVEPKNKNNGKTFVRDALGRVEIYTYDHNLRLKEIKGPRRIESFRWGTDEREGDLLQRIVEEPNKPITLAIRYHYDQFGNVINQQTYGCLTGADSQIIGTDGEGFVCGSEHHDICRQYSNDGLNLLIREESGRNTKTFEYKPGTNLKIKELLWEGNIIRQRHFYSYDKNCAITEEIIDDGITGDFNNLEGVTQRLITKFSNSQITPVGLPIEISAYALDLSSGNEILLSRKVNHYNQRGLILSQEIYDANNNLNHAIHFDYDIQGNMIKKIDARGNITTYAYNILNQLIEEEGPEFKKSFKFDIKGNLIAEVTHNPDMETHNDYDVMGRKVKSTDFYGQKTRYEYDCDGNVSTMILPSGSIIKTSYNLLGNPTIVTDERGFTTKTDYNVRRQPIHITFPDGSCEKKTYTIDGLLKTHIFREGHQVVYEHDYQGRIIHEQTLADGKIISQIQRTYNAFNLLSETDPNGNTTFYEYDYAGRLISTRKENVLKQIAYDSMGRVYEQKTDIMITRYEYDQNENIIKQTQLNEEGIELSSAIYLYDSQNRCIEETTGEATKRTFYDSLGRITKEVDALGHETLTIYDDKYINEKGQIVLSAQTIDPLGNITVKVNDIDGNLAIVIRKNYLNQTLAREEYEYDFAGNRTAIHTTVMQPSGNEYAITSRFTYDWEGNVTSCIEAEGYPEQKITRHVYNNFGQKIQTIKSDGIELYYTYDLIGRLHTLQSSEGTISYEYHYDFNGDPTQVVSQNGITKREYDAHDRIISETLENGLVIGYKYDSSGQLIQLTYPDGTRSAYTYNGNRLVKVERLGSKPYTHEYLSFDDLENPTRSRLIDGVSEIITSYDLLGRTTNILAPSWKCQEVKYDSMSQLLSMKVKDDYGTVSFKFTYDNLYQLTSEKGIETNHFKNDSVSNITLHNEIPRKNNTLNQLIDASYAYDFNGNLIKTSKMHFSYDALDRLIEVQKDSETIHYTYDPWNRRMSKSTGEKYLYVNQDEVGSYIDNRCVSLRLLGEGKGAEIGASVAIELEGVAYIPVHDIAGNLVSLINSETDEITTYRYTAYGKQVQENHLNNPWQFSGKRYDCETGFVNFGRRYYSPEMMKWITPDPIGFEDGPNLYAYVHNSPLTHFDEYGLFGCSTLKEFSVAASRGVLDDASWGASEYLLGEYNCQSSTSKCGYWFGSGGSFALGLVSGSSEAKVVKYVGGHFFSFSKSLYNQIKRFYSVSNAEKAINETGKIVNANKKISEKLSNNVNKISNLDQIRNNISKKQINFVGTKNGEIIIIPKGARGPFPTRASGMQFLEGEGGFTLNSRVTGVRIMDKNLNQGPRVIYMNKNYQTVDCETGRTLSNSHPNSHLYLKQ